MTDAHPFRVGDQAVPADLPADEAWRFAVQVDGISTCDDEGCDEPTIWFKDPATGGLDEAHADQFTHVGDA